MTLGCWFQSSIFTGKMNQIDRYDIFDCAAPPPNELVEVPSRIVIQIDKILRNGRMFDSLAVFWAFVWYRHAFVYRILHMMILYFCQSEPHTHTHTHTSASIVSTSMLDTSYQSCEMAQSSRIHMTFDRLWFYMYFPSKIQWDLTNGPLSKLLELLDTQV